MQYIVDDSIYFDKAVDVVDSGEHALAVKVDFLVEGEAVAFNAANCRAIGVHGVLHADLGGAAGRASVGVLTCAALRLAVSSSILGKEQVGDVVVHKTVYLLHAAQHRVVVEVSPRHARGRAAA
mgnify:CR=1 FL=1